MAVVTRDLFQAGQGGADAHVTLTFNDANGAISALDANVGSGMLEIVVLQAGKQPIDVLITPDGRQAADGRNTLASPQHINVPAGYNLTQGPRGDWVWRGPSVEFTWTTG